MRRVLRFVGSVLTKVYVEPVVHDRLRMINWPRGLPMLALIGTVAYTIAMIMAVATGWLRRVLRLELLWGVDPVGMPGGLTWVLMAMLMLSAVLLQTGALHASWWLRVLMLSVSGSMMINIGYLPGAGPEVFIALVGWLALVVFQILRWRRSYAWWEYAVVALCFLIGLLAGIGALTGARVYGDTAGDWAGVVMPRVALIAAPMTMLAGYAIAQWAFGTVVWTVDLGSRQVSRRILLIALVLLLAWRLLAEWWNLAQTVLTPELVLAPAGLLAASLAVWLLLDRIADRRGRTTTRLTDLSSDLRLAALPAAMAILASQLLDSVLGVPVDLAATVLPVFSPVSAVVELIGAFAAGTVFGFIGCLALLGWAISLAVRGDRGRSELVALIALSFLGTRLFSTRGATDLLGVWVVTTLAVIFVVLLVRRRLSRRRLEGLLLAVGLATVISTRQLFANPIDAVLGGSAALLLGLVWQFVTSGADGNGDSPAFPRPARVLMVLGYSLLAMSVLAYDRMTLSSLTVLESMEAFGDEMLGGSLLLAALIVVTLAVVRDADAGVPTPEPEEVAASPSATVEGGASR